MKGKIFLFWTGVIFTLIVPILIGLVFKNTSTMWVAAVCGVFITVVARFEDITEVKLGPLQAKMRETIKEANATIEELRRVASISAKAIFTDLMAGGFMGGMKLKTRLDLHDQIISALKEIGASDNAIKDAESMWSKGIGIIYHRAIKDALDRHIKSLQVNPKAPQDIQKAGDQLQKMLQFEEWRAPTPDEMESFIESKGIMTEEILEWISDYRHYIKTGEIKRRNIFEKQ